VATTLESVSIDELWASAGTQLPMVAAGLVGRDSERARLGWELQRVRSGHGAVLVLRGGHGIGKTALLDCAVRRAQGFRVIRARGAESEVDFPYAALQLLCGPLLDDLERLQPPHRAALSTAVGSSTGPRPDPFLVGLAVLGLFSLAAERGPVLCVVDDAQWLDRPSAHVLAFVARRLDAQPIMMLLGRRDTPHLDDVDRLPELQVGGLSPTDSRTLLGQVVPGRVDEPVVERIITEARGNPLAILELRSAMSPADLAGGLGVTSMGERLGPMEDDFLGRVGLVPPESQRLLLAAAAEPLGDPSLLWRAALHLAVPPDAARPLESGGLLRFGSRVVFPRPLLRPVVYGVATDDERRCVHRALARATDAAADPVRRAWHLAHAAVAPDETLARELEGCAPLARERGGLAAAAALLEKATLLTLEPRPRVDRALAAAAAERGAGADLAAARLLQTAEMGPLDERAQCRLERQRAQVASALGHADDAAELLLRSARQLEPLDPGLARATYLEALAAGISAGQLGLGHNEVDIAKAAEAGPPVIPPGRPIDRLLDALVVRYSRGCAAAAEPLGRALGEFRRTDAGDDDTRSRWLACLVAAELWDDETWHTQTSLAVRRARETGALAVLPAALDTRAVAELQFGEFAAASVLIEEAARVSRATGTPAVPQAALLRAAWRGREDRALTLFQAARREAFDRGEGRTLSTVGLAATVLLNSLGRYDEAVAAARTATENDDLGLLGWTLAELVEAAVRAGEPDAAAVALERLAERTRASGTDWALGMEAGSRALLSDAQTAEGLFQEAVHRLGRTRIRSHLARTQLLYGEWLRRQGRRLDARQPLRAARESFTSMGAAAFAERAHRELLATGEKVRSRSVGGDRQLTPQEARIAALARDGLSNPAIGARLFVSPRTVEYHLHKVFSKLEVSSRGELHLALPTPASPSPGGCEPGALLRTRPAAHR
jgi:DNA-binding CsgD family transcriptional regulator/tetratricopeptide (TPR) repeat protein